MFLSRLSLDVGSCDLPSWGEVDASRSSELPRQWVDALRGGAVDTGAGPFAPCVRDELPGLAVGKWGVGPLATMPQAKFRAGRREVLCAATDPVVGLTSPIVTPSPAQ